MATNADKPDTAWYSTVQELQDKFNLEQEKRGSRSFQQIAQTAKNFLKDPSDKDKRRSDKSPMRKSSIFDQLEESQKVGNKTKTLPRNFSAKDFSLENTWLKNFEAFIKPYCYATQRMLEIVEATQKIYNIKDIHQ